MQHQLDSARVELEMEKRALARLLAKGDEKQLREEHLNTQLEELQSNLAKAGVEKQKTWRELQDAVCSLETQKVHFEARQNTLKNKLRATQDQLSALAKLPRANDAVKDPSGGADGLVRKSRKRAAQPNLEAGIGTPGNLPAGTKLGLGPRLVGDKSSFSITPYLNRNSRSANDIALSSPVGKTESLAMTSVRQEGKWPAEAASHIRTDHDDSYKPTNPAGAAFARSSTVAHTALSTGHADITGIGMTPGRQDQPSDSGADRSAGARPSFQLPEGGLHPEPPARKKKRMLGGQRGETLFDNDEPEGSKHYGTDPWLGSRPRTLGLSGLGTKPSRSGRILKSVSTDAFSPLKRDWNVIRP